MVNLYCIKWTLIAKGDDDSAEGDLTESEQLFSAVNRLRSWQVSWRCPGSIYKNAQAKLETFDEQENSEVRAQRKAGACLLGQDAFPWRG